MAVINVIFYLQNMTVQNMTIKTTTFYILNVAVFKLSYYMVKSDGFKQPLY